MPRKISLKIREITLETDVLSVAGGMWTTTPQMSHRLADHSKYVQKQPERHGKRQLTAHISMFLLTHWPNWVIQNIHLSI